MMSTLLSVLDLPGVAKGLKGGSPRDGDDSRLLKAEASWLEGKLVLPHGCLLGEGASTHAEYFIAGLEPGHLGADDHHRAGHVYSGHSVLRAAEAVSDDPHEVGLARHEMPGAPIHPGRGDVDKHFVGRDMGPIDLGQTQDLARAICVLDNGSHLVISRWGELRCRALDGSLGHRGDSRVQFEFVSFLSWLSAG